MEQLHQQFSFVRPEEAQSIPNTAGVYGFLFNPYQRGKLGLYPGKERSSKAINEAKRALIRKLRVYEELKNSKEINAELNVHSPAGNKEERYRGVVGGAFRRSDFTEIQSLDADEFVSYLKMASSSTILSQALYCGMTIHQGLHQRYLQHKYDHQVEKEGSFGGRLANHSFNWEDLVFVYSSLLPPSENARSIKLLERHMIDMFNPILSVR